MMRIDMHLHSSASDGARSPREVARLARRARVCAASLTDHDTIDGIEEFASECRRFGVHPISGIELSADAPYTVHILGYRLTRPQVIRDASQKLIEEREVRNVKVCEKLVALGVDITIDEVRAAARGKVIARPHIAEVLVKKGAVRDKQEAFDRYLAGGAPAYVKRASLDPAQCIELIREAGGVSVLAHPSLTKLAGDELMQLLSELRAAGLWGLECFSGHCSSEAALGYLTAAERCGLFPTAGSDFHGTGRHGRTIGVQVSDAFLPWARLGISL